MTSFCAELESGAHRNELQTYRNLVENIAEWYQNAYEAFSPRLLLEGGMHSLYEDIEKLKDQLAFTEDLNYNFSAKLSYFSVSDALVKLILSKYSYGASSQFLTTYGIDYPITDISIDKAYCWLKCQATEVVLTEILAKVLSVENAECSFDLACLMVDRSDRSHLTHQSQAAACLSAIRCYNTIRAMIVFLDPEYEQQLHVFELAPTFNYDEFLADPCKLDFDTFSTVLVADSVHDLRKDYQEAIANLPWNIVVDLDGHSDCGGLMSAINHNQVSRGILTIANQDTIAKGITYWYRCGTYQFPSYQPSQCFHESYYKKNKVNIPSSVPFHSGRIQRGSTRAANISAIISNLFHNINQFDRPINIVMVTNNSNIVNDVVRFLRQTTDDYVITWVGLSSKSSDDILHDWYYNSEEEMSTHFKYFNCPIEQFYEVFEEHKGSWKYRTTLTKEFSLPGSDGPVKISENERINLLPYFDVLYEGVDVQDRDTARNEREGFDTGNIAAWSVISSEYAVSLKKRADIERMKTYIKSILGTVIKGKLQNKLYFIKHKAGMGGTTLCRQLAWSLHKEYAVLIVKKYNQGAITDLVSKLYDNSLGKAPIILVADDTNASLKNICEEVMHLERRCILLAACRQDSPILADYPYAKAEPLTRLSDEVVDKLRDHFRQASALDPVLLNQRDMEFRNELQGDLQSPFIIGLYYLEKEYNIAQYVKKAVDGSERRQYHDVLARLAICDKYNYKDVPKSLVNRAAGLNVRENFLRIVSSADSILCTESYGDVDCYRFKHPLLSDEFFAQYAERYYNGSVELATFEIAQKLIDDVASLSDPKEEHFDLLVIILIQSKVSMSDEGLYLSALLTMVGTNNCKLLLDKLSATFSPRADLIVQKAVSTRTSIEKTILRTVSHSYAHLGRVYSRIERNARKAEENMKRAMYYMPDEDPNIYHMAGTSIYDNLRQHCDETLPQVAEGDQQIEYEKLEKMVADASNCFDKACDSGSPDYGLPSKIKLIYRYLSFVYKVKGIKNELEANVKLSPNQQKLRQEFLLTLEFANSYSDLSAPAMESLRDYEGRFYSDLLFGDYGKVIEYYENSLSNARQHHDAAQEVHALTGLVFARINAAKAKSPAGESYYRAIKNPNQLKDYIEELLKRPSTESGYRTRMQRNRLFHHWVQLAKITSTSLEYAMSLIQQWYDFEEENQQRKDPEPYYYMRTLHYLSALDGNQRSLSEAMKIAQKIRIYADTNRFDRSRSNQDHIKDIVVEGTGLGQLYDVSFCSNDDQAFLNVLAVDPQKPVVITGQLTSVENNALAEITVSSPMQWYGTPVSIRIGKSAANSLSENQINHSIQFFMGFSFRKPTALADTAADKENESFDGFTLLSKLHDKMGKKADNNTPHRAQITRPKPVFIEKEKKPHIHVDPPLLPKAPDASPSPTQALIDSPASYPDLNSKEVLVVLSESNHLSGSFVYEGTEYPIKLTPVSRKTEKLLIQYAKKKKAVTCRICGKPEKGKYTAKLKENFQ